MKQHIVEIKYTLYAKESGRACNIAVDQRNKWLKNEVLLQKPDTYEVE